MKTLLFGKRDPRRQRRSTPVVGAGLDPAFDTVNSTVLLTPEFDKGNDDVTAIRSSLGLVDAKRPPQE